MSTRPINQNALKRARPKKRAEYTICAFDMETRGLGGEHIITAFWAEDGTKATFLNLEDTFNFMVENPHYRYLAHNASGYEFAYLYPYIHQYFDGQSNIEVKPTIQGESRIIQFLILRDGKPWLDMRDTLCLFNMSLSNVAKSFAPHIPKGEPPWNAAHDNFDPSSKLWMDYLWRDCEIILIAYRAMDNMIWELFHSHLGITAGSTAMKAFRASIPLVEGTNKSYVYYRLDEKLENFMREGYYGAAVFPGHFIGNWGKVASVDINAAYGYQMLTHQFPTRAPFKTRKYREGELGMYRVIAHVPHSLYKELGFCPIPSRNELGLAWVTGDFETTITSFEIEYGLKHGCTFEILEGYTWITTEPVFTEFIKNCQQLELAEEGKYKPTIKLIRNSLYGKFGTKPRHKIVKFSKELPLDLAPMINETTGEIIDGVFTGEEASEMGYIMPHWAAFITAYERIYLFQFMEEAYKRGAKNVYCDTDSIKADAPVLLSMVRDGFIPVGIHYGELKVEEIVDEFILIGPKTYYGRDSTGKEIKKAKGVPYHLLTRNVYVDALNNERKQMQFDTVQNVMRLIKSKGGQLPIKRKRTLTDIRNSTTWEITQNGEIYPYHYQKHLQRVA